MCPALHPELERLVELGLLERALAGDGTRGDGSFARHAMAAARRGELTLAQAALLGALLGVEVPGPANDA